MGEASWPGDVMGGGYWGEGPDGETCLGTGSSEASRRVRVRESFERMFISFIKPHINLE